MDARERYEQQRAQRGRQIERSQPSGPGAVDDPGETLREHVATTPAAPPDAVTIGDATAGRHFAHALTIKPAPAPDYVFHVYDAKGHLVAVYGPWAEDPQTKARQLGEQVRGYVTAAQVIGNFTGG